MSAAETVEPQEGMKTPSKIWSSNSMDTTLDRDCLTPPLIRNPSSSSQSQSMFETQRTPSPKTTTLVSDPDSPDIYLATPELKKTKLQISLDLKHQSQRSILNSLPFDITEIDLPLSPIVRRQTQTHIPDTDVSYTLNSSISYSYPSSASALKLAKNFNNKTPPRAQAKRRLTFEEDSPSQKENVPLDSSSSTTMSESEFNSPNLLLSTPHPMRKAGTAIHSHSSGSKFMFRPKPSTAIISFEELISSSQTQTPQPITVSEIESERQSEFARPETPQRSQSPEVPTPLSTPTTNTNEVEVCTISSDSEDDDDFIPAWARGPLNSANTQVPNLRPCLTASSNSQLQSSPSLPLNERTNPPKRRRRRKRNQHVFILEEVDVVGQESSDEDEDNLLDLEDQDPIDEIFVSSGESSPVTNTQMCRYYQSTNKTPERPFGKRKSLGQVALEALENNTNTGEEYEIDTFCVPNGIDHIEYEEIGDFTQCMNKAIELEREKALEMESPSSSCKRNLRSKTRKDETFKIPTTTTKPRKRIRVISSSSDSE